MSDEVEYRCFIGNLSWSISDRDLKDEFVKFGKLIEAKVVIDRVSGRSRGFGFVTFDEKEAMEDAIKSMNGMDIDGRPITVDKAQPNPGSGRDGDRVRDRDHGSRGTNGGDCFKCGKPGHFARECPGEESRSSRYGGSRDDRYGGSRNDRYGGSSRDDRYGDGGKSHYGSSKNGDRFSGRDRDSGSSRGGSRSDRYNRDRSGPYDR